MTRRPHILHLVDDTTAGGVMRMVDYMRSDPELVALAEHDVRVVERGKRLGDLGPADLIVSHLTVSWRGLPALIALRLSRMGTHLVHVEHSYTAGFMRHRVRRARRFRTLLRIAYGLCDRVICVSNGQADWMVAQRLACTDRLYTIQSCVDLRPFRALPAPAQGEEERPIVFGAIGRLDVQKGFDVLLAAFRSCPLPNIRLQVIGTGDQEPRLRRLASEDPRIRFCGYQEDTAAALAEIDVVVMPSRWEAYGLVAIEALAAGRRVLCHDIDGLSDHARSGAVMFDTPTRAGLKRLIAREAEAFDAPDRPSPVRQTRKLETRFRDSWWHLLQELGLVASCLERPGESGAMVDPLAAFGAASEAKGG